jgi:guanine deaminase
MQSYFPATAVRGAFLDFIDDPFFTPAAQSVRYLRDGLLVIDQGKIQAFGPYAELAPHFGYLPTITHPQKLLLPGFIDLHIHYPQTEMIAAYGAQLMEWLEQYTFPTEAKFKDLNYARTIANFFINELLRNGTTTAVVMPTTFPESVQALFETAEDHQMRLIAGQVLMSRHTPAALVNDAHIAYGQMLEQIQTWHGRGRLLYAITPRFAITSTPEELTLAGQLKQQHPGIYVHTHLSENLKEIEQTAALFPTATDYLNVYEQFGLVGERTVLAHCIHLDNAAFARLSHTGAAIAFCPTSNLFLGSGLFRLGQAKSAQAPVSIGLATDVGGGTSFSLLQTMADAYKVMQLQGESLSAFQAFYLATLGSAQALSLDDQLGNFMVGKEADFIALNLQATPLMALRNPNPLPHTLETLADALFATMMLGDDRAIAATYIAGMLAYRNN